MKETTQKITPRDLLEKTKVMIKKTECSIKKMEKNLSAAKKRLAILKGREGMLMLEVMKMQCGVQSDEELMQRMDSIVNGEVES